MKWYIRAACWLKLRNNLGEDEDKYDILSVTDRPIGNKDR